MQAYASPITTNNAIFYLLTLSSPASSSQPPVLPADIGYEKSVLLHIVFEYQAPTESPEPTTIVPASETHSAMTNLAKNMKIHLIPHKITQNLRNYPFWNVLIGRMTPYHCQSHLHFLQNISATYLVFTLHYQIPFLHFIVVTVIVKIQDILLISGLNITVNILIHAPIIILKNPSIIRTSLSQLR